MLKFVKLTPKVWRRVVKLSKNEMRVYIGLSYWQINPYTAKTDVIRIKHIQKTSGITDADNIRKILRQLIKKRAIRKTRIKAPQGWHQYVLLFHEKE